MQRTVYIARTASDLTHLNKMAIPEFGVVSLAVATDTKASKSHLPAGAPPPSTPDTGTEDFHFVPEKETVEIRYELDDRFLLIDSGKLELFTRFSDTALWTLDLKTLGADWLAHGKHVVKWDGRIVKPTAEQKGTPGASGMANDLTTIAVDKTVASFPDGYTTLEFTPYKLKLTVASTVLKGRGNPELAWTYFQILIKSIDLELGPEEAIPNAAGDDALKRDKAVRKQIETDGGVPAAGATVRKVILLSNLYKKSLPQMDNDTAFTVYKTLWGDGPNIPIIAKIRLADSNDAEVKLESDKGAVALGKVKFLWDWTDVAENVDAQQASPKAKAFIKDAINYYKDGTDSTRAAKDHTYPKGDNCHVDRGGKRGPDAKAIFPVQPGYDPKDTLDAGKFPFKVEAPQDPQQPNQLFVRKWAALSQGWTSGKLKGQTGIIFQPSRMGGDSYTITVFLAYDKSKKDTLALDIKDEPLVAATAIQKSTGTFQVWREIHLARYIRKLSTMGQFFPGAAGGVATHFNRAYIGLEDKTAGNIYAFSDHRLKNGTQPDYNALIRAKLTGSGNIIFTHNLATDAAADHSAVDSMVVTRTYAKFVKSVHLDLNPGVPAAANDFSSLATGSGYTEDQWLEYIGMDPTVRPSNPSNDRIAATRTWLQSNYAKTAEIYCRTLSNWCFGFGEPLAGEFQCVTGSKNGVGKESPDGLITLEFNHTHTFLRDQKAAGLDYFYWYGAAVDPGDADDHRSVIMFWLAGVDFFAHEAGHHVFLPHAKYPLTSPPDGARDYFHDDTDAGCLMSYSNVRQGYCGLCQLRLRGWDAGVSGAPKLDKISANNKKP